MRKCFIHAGTHKTGTTSLQIVSNQRRQALRRHNYLYPSTGRPPEGPHGHHNLAWEISQDRRFRPEYGTLDDLVAVIDDEPQHVILSSEDFECSVFHEDRFAEFLEHLRSRDLDITFIVYLRNQVDYAQSLYQTMVTLGLPCTFAEFVGAIVDEGRFCWQEWIFPFCYQDFLTRLESFDGTSLIVRSYDNPPQHSLIADYFSILGLTPEALDIDSGFQANARPPIVTSVTALCENRRGAALDPTELAIAACLTGPGPSPRPRLSDASREAIARRFRQSNAYVVERYGLPEWDALERPAGHSEGTPAFEAVFSAEFASCVTRVVELFRSEYASLQAVRNAAAPEDAAALAAECEALRQEIATMAGSRSWRLTAPMRGAHAVLGASLRRLRKGERK